MNRASKESPPRKIPVSWDKKSAGAGPSEEWLRALGMEDRNVIGQDLMRIQYRWPAGMPLRRPLSGGLWEVRSSLPQSHRARSVFRGGRADRRGASLREKDPKAAGGRHCLGCQANEGDGKNDQGGKIRIGAHRWTNSAKGERDARRLSGRRRQRGCSPSRSRAAMNDAASSSVAALARSARRIEPEPRSAADSTPRTAMSRSRPCNAPPRF